jgi:transposase
MSGKMRRKKTFRRQLEPADGSYPAKRGKNKQGRSNLRQVGYALFCTADGHVPLMYDVYDGNRNDARQFPEMLDRFAQFMKEIGGQADVSSKTTVVFDKGNNSKDNFALLGSLKLKFVGAVRLDQVKELAGISNKDSRFSPCETPNLNGTQAFRVSKKLYGMKRTLVVTYNQNLFNAQWLTLQNDIASAMTKLDALSERLAQRASGLITGGKAPTVESVKRQCATIRKRQHIEKLIQVKVTEDNGGVRLACEIDADAVAHLADTYLGKNILITNRDEWSDDKIIEGYRSQYIIEDVFKEMKDRQTGSWWPMFHWTDSKIQVHGLYCTIALLLRAVAYRRVRNAGISISMKRMLTALSGVKEVVNVFEPKRKGKEPKRQTVFTKTSELQARLLKICASEQ